MKYVFSAKIWFVKTSSRIVKYESFSKQLYGPFLWSSTASRLEPLSGGSLLFTIKFPEIPGTYFIDLGRMNS